eukprot:1091033-Pelagomonas_calceolata.AAC.3
MREGDTLARGAQGLPRQYSKKQASVGLVGLLAAHRSRPHGYELCVQGKKSTAILAVEDQQNRSRERGHTGS